MVFSSNLGRTSSERSIEYNSYWVDPNPPRPRVLLVGTGASVRSNGFFPAVFSYRCSQYRIG
jgi:hypothetical protein